MRAAISPAPEHDIGCTAAQVCIPTEDSGNERKDTRFEKGRVVSRPEKRRRAAALQKTRARGLGVSCWELVERQFFVYADVGGQGEHPFGNDIEENFVGSARDAQARGGKVGILASNFP